MFRWWFSHQQWVIRVFTWVFSKRVISVLMYTRAAASDYDDWEKAFKNPGWGSADLIPLLQKVLVTILVLC